MGSFVGPRPPEDVPRPRWRYDGRKARPGQYRDRDLLWILPYRPLGSPLLYAPPPQDVTNESAPRFPERLRDRWLGHLLHFVLPAPCLACGIPRNRARDTLGLCEGCRAQLVAWPRDGCARCGRPIFGEHPEGYACGRCRRRKPPFDHLESLWIYQEPLDATLLALKFRRLEYLGDNLGHRLAEAFEDSLLEVDTVVPVPLHWRRRFARGYNQSEVIARSMARAAGLPLLHALRRVRPTPPQSRLPRDERQRNLRDAFRCRRRLEGRRVVLVDDVVTTGATVSEAARCLRRAGAEHLLVLTVGRTPEPGQVLPQTNPRRNENRTIDHESTSSARHCKLTDDHPEPAFDPRKPATGAVPLGDLPSGRV